MKIKKGEVSFDDDIARIISREGLKGLEIHSLVSLQNRHYCHSCFCCACVDFLKLAETGCVDVDEFIKANI